MDRDRLTFVVMRGASSEPRTLHVPRRIVPYVTAGAAALAIFLVGSSLFLLFGLGSKLSATRLERENALLQESLTEMEQRVDQLSETVVSISERDRRFRLLAGLPEIDPEVRQVGIGGPGTESRESEPLARMGSELADDVFSSGNDLNRLLRQANLLEVSLEEAVRAMEGHRARLTGYPSIDPTDGWVSSTFSQSRYHPILNVRRPHEGIDISAWPGTPVVATADGTVSFSGWRPGFGYTVEIDHGNGFKTRYGHNQKNLQVRKGDRVRRGDVIAYVGSTGVSTAPHVHYEVIKDGRPVNPADHRLEEVIVE